MRPIRFPPRARVIQVIEFTTSEGAGTDEEVVRRVVYYLSLDGKVLARGDELEDEVWKL